MTSQLISHFKPVNEFTKMMLLSLLVIQGFLTSAGKPVQNKTGKLVENIRRQLMENNYDYQPSEDDITPPAHHYDQDMPNDPLYNDNDTLADSTERQDGDRFAHRASSKEDSKENDHAISKKDLFYYMDDDKMRRAANNVDEAEENDDADNTSPKVKYKVLKVKSLNPNRRSSSIRRFIQEETEQGVSIVSLDGEPFPEFYLPRARRQYMQGVSGELNGGANATAVPAFS